jgi:hypothetical protein
MERPQDIPVKKLISALLAIAFGTIIEWVRKSMQRARLYTFLPLKRLSIAWELPRPSSYPLRLYVLLLPTYAT